ncbi:MAG: molybdenum cofactor biosynthesis protein MoaE [Thermoplasmata archaeon]|nr:molybdenum cofactor biosynthesis protein MoaE [Thermoplasmata archaeon]
MGVLLTEKPLSVPAAYRALSDPELGGVVVFVGRVRPDLTSGGAVRSLFYEAHEAVAHRELERLRTEVARRLPKARVILWHRLGELRVGTVSVIVGVATPHRAAAFDLARELIDRLKVEVPIWKSDRTRPARRPRPPRASGRSTG